MRHLLILVLIPMCVAVLKAADPTPQPYPDGPLLRVCVGNAAQMRARLAATWYSRCWSAPAAEPLRTRMIKLVSDAEAATGIAWNVLIARSSRLDLETGARTMMTFSGVDSAAVVVAGVDAAIGADEQRVNDYRRALAEFAKTSVRSVYVPGTAPVDPSPQLSVFAPVVRTSSGIVIGRVRKKFEHLAREAGEWLVGTAGTTVTISHIRHPGEESVAAKLLPATHQDVDITVDLAAYVDSFGIPGLGSVLRQCGATRLIGGIDFSSGRSIETFSLPGAHLPLRPIDAAVLEAEIPAPALAFSAVGIDGPALAHAIAQVAADEPGLVPLTDPLSAAIAGLNGTAWFAVMPGTPLPDMVIGLPANDAVDTWLEQAFPRHAPLLAEARKHAVALEPHPGLPSPLVVRRTARAWLIGTDAAAFEKLGMPGLAGRLAREHLIPPTASAVSIQATQPFLQQLGSYALLAQLWLVTQKPLEELPRLPTGEDIDELRFTRAQLADLRMLVGAFPGLVAAAKAPTTVGYLISDQQGATVHGRDLVIGVATLPMMLVGYGDLLPLVAPQWTVSYHGLLASRWAVGKWPWVDNDVGWQGYHHTGFPDAKLQLRALALRSPNPSTRGVALWHISNNVDETDRELAEVLMWLRRGLADAEAPTRNDALRGLKNVIDRPGVLPLLTGAFTHPDAKTRTAAYTQVAEAGALYRQSHRQPQADGRIRLPAALEALLVAEATERDANAAVPLMQALGGYDDARVDVALVRRLDDPSALVAVEAAAALSWPPFIAHHQAQVLAAVARLRRDSAPSGDFSQTVGHHATSLLYQRLFGPEAEALIVEDLNLPDPPDSDPYDISPHFSALTTLAQRGYAPALPLVDAALQPLPDHPALPWALLYALSQCPLAEAEAPIERTLRLADPVKNPAVRFQAVSALQMRAIKTPLAAVSLQTVINACLFDPAIARTAARRLLDRQQLTVEQSAAFASVVQRAITQFGEQAFPGYQPPKIPEPEPPPIKIGADDF